MTRRIRSNIARASALTVASLASVALLAACTSSRERTSPPAREAVSAAAKPSPAPPVLPAIAAQVGAMTVVGEAAMSPTSAPNVEEEKPEATPAKPAPRRAGDVLATFYGALRELSSGARKKHVRVLWLGDSHGAADFWSGNLRTELQTRFGNGGPGFLHLGYREYRHDGVKTSVGGKWKMRPGNPATRSVTGDGIFGLGGILFVASAESPRGTVTITEPTAPAKMTWDLCYRLTSADDELRVSLTGQPDTVLKATDAEPAGAVRHVVLTSDTPGATFGAAVTAGTPELCGLVAEGDPKAQAGVVLDTLGINGARFSTPLAWNEASWASELSRRDPDLVVLEYGTNELSDWPLKTTSFTEPLRALMARIRKVRPDVDCVVLAPTDRADAEERVPIGRDAVREGALESGCAFWDTYAIMGGKGAIRAWQSEKPPKAAKDGIHLAWRGYRELGTKLAEDLMRGYTP